MNIRCVRRRCVKERLLRLTYGEAVVSPWVSDAVSVGRADGRGVVLLCKPLTVWCICARESWSLQQWQASPGRVHMCGDAERTDAEGSAFPGRTCGRRDTHHTRCVHTDGDEKVLRCVLTQRRGSGRVLDDERVDIERPGHDFL